MKNSYTYLLLLAFCLVSASSFAQTKEQKKAQKEELRMLKKMSPAEIKAIINRRDQAQEDLNKCNAVSKELKSIASDKDDEIDRLNIALKQRDYIESALRDSIDMMRQGIYGANNTGGDGFPGAIERPGANASVGQATTNVKINRNVDFNNPTGVYYRVQLAAYNKGKLPESVSQELIVEEDGKYSKLLKGLFYDYNDADLVKRYFRKLGIRDAWVVCYQDGNRISKRQAMKLQGN